MIITLSYDEESFLETVRDAISRSGLCTTVIEKFLDDKLKGASDKFFTTKFDTFNASSWPRAPEPFSEIPVMCVRDWTRKMPGEQLRQLILVPFIRKALSEQRSYQLLRVLRAELRPQQLLQAAE